MPDPVAVSQERSLEFVSVDHAYAINKRDDGPSLVVSVDHAVDASATGKLDPEDGIAAVRASTAGDGNPSRLLEVIESFFLVWSLVLRIRLIHL